jgi:methyl-accepting chemotaxis protein
MEAIEAMISEIENINELSAENARTVEEIAAASEHLSNMTARLNQLLAQYRT